MKRFLVEVSLFVALQVVAALGWLVYQHRHDDNFFGVSADKERLLATAPGPRIVFVGGSSAAFGIDSEMLAQRLGYHPVNMGLNAPFGLRYMLRETKASLRSGDVVVLTPEYEHFVSEDYARGRLTPEHWGLLMFLNPATLRHAPKEVFREMFLTVRGNSALLKGYRQVGDRKVGEVYRRQNFNRYGDLVLPEKHADSVFTYQPRSVTPNRAAAVSLARHVGRFVDWCRAHEVQVFWAWPPLVRDKYLANARTFEEVEEVVERALPVEVVLHGREAALPANRFFDSDYHLNRSGRRERSERLCERLSHVLKRTETAKATPLP